MRGPEHRRGVCQLVLAALCWSLGGLLVKAVPWPGIAIAGGRGALAAFFLLATSRDLRFRLSADQLAGAAAYAACTITFCIATKLTTAANAILLEYTAPVWIALLGSRWVGERATKFDWAVIACVLGGMTLFFAGQLDFVHLAGNVVGIVCGVSLAAMTLALRRQKDRIPVESIIVGNLIAFAAGMPWILRAPSLPASGWIPLILLGTVQLGFPYWLYARAIRHVTALEAVLVPVLEPILNPVWVLVALGERPAMTAIAGGILVLTATSLRALISLRSTPISGNIAPPG